MSPAVLRITLALVLVFAGSFGFDVFKASLAGFVVLGVMTGSLIWLLSPLFRGTIPLRRVSVAQREAFERDRAATAAGCATLYVFRAGYIGMTSGFIVTLDGVQLAILRSPRYVRVPVSAGAHSCEARVGGFGGATLTPVAVSFEAVAGETIVFALATENSGLKASATLTREIDVPAALTRMAGMKRVAAHNVSNT